MHAIFINAFTRWLLNSFQLFLMMIILLACHYSKLAGCARQILKVQTNAEEIWGQASLWTDAECLSLEEGICIQMGIGTVS